MNWNDYFLWAALILLFEIFYHFFRQRTLWDKNSKIFMTLVGLGMLYSLSGIGLTHLQMTPQEEHNQIIKLFAALNYLINTALPFHLLRFALTLCDDYEKYEKQIVAVGSAVWLLGAVFIIANIPLGFISYAKDGLLWSGPLFEVYGSFLLIYFLVDFCLVLKFRKLLGQEATKALLEVHTLIVIGLFFQYFIHIQLFWGFALSVAILTIYILLKSPHTYIDEDTHIYNVNYFHMWMRDRKKHWNGSLLVIDFYNLESIGFIYMGHTKEKIIAKIAEHLCKFREKSPIFRVAPSRFVFCTQSSQELAGLIQKIEGWLEQGVYIDQKYIKCRALLTEVQMNHIENIKELKAYTDFLVHYGLKRSDTAVLYDSAELKMRVDYNMEIEHFLHTAIEQDLFQVCYQPIYSAEHKKYVSLEALSRLNHPKLGWVSPELFIQIAEKHGWATKITQLQLAKICRFIKDNAEDLRNIRQIKINLSPSELLETGYCEKLLTIIRQNSIPFSKIQFEVTETTATQYTQETFSFIRELQKVGIGLCLDDFGSGYANLNTVLSLPYSTIKMDRSLLQGICESPKKADFYKDLFSIIKKQGFSIIAEGVETEQEAALLLEWNVDLFQGYYFSRPVPDTEIISLLRKEAKQ